MNLLECVSNISEGKDRSLVDSLVQAVKGVSGVNFLHATSDPDHHRSVLTFAGTPERVLEAALASCGLAVEHIDMRNHRGVHPRLGAVDVVPFVPLGDLPMARAVQTAHEFGRQFAGRHGIPVFYYGEAARTAKRIPLEAVRRGEYEGLQGKLADPRWKPDEGPCRFHAKSGATAVGARGILIAFNVNLASQDLESARAVARAVRARDGGLPAVKAIGVKLRGRRMVQVSVNLVDYRITPWSQIIRRIAAEAESRGLPVSDLEIIGLVPRAATVGLEECGIPLPTTWKNQVIEEALANA
ncbi:MAG: glutamate formimidoyltransferase [Candidatus Tectomicrobia bacterium]|uniref:glutamate formimidoyltransferase n=1 Tax=Tectimicrobiota bacterium TaxID=2528274 RepID=A0A932GRZ8_UNCTE|nr:glutamate formimidoyltransferase [Candidatus Tectomicrobia bacterium]